MKVFISYPPLESLKGVPLLGQNRQFQWFSSKSYIYPMVPAYAATLLKSKGYDVVWDDAIAEEKTFKEWLDSICKEKPDVILIETKTPVVERHWEIAYAIKNNFAGAKVVLCGDHVTALPQESMKNCPCDYVITGGDYDFLLLNICEHIKSKKPLEPGIWYREGKKIKNTGMFKLDHDLTSLPMIDRELTKWQLYKENGNYKHLPGTYMYSGRDCWWAKCRFCSWTGLYPEYRVRTVEQQLDEVGALIEKYGIREIMDDTGTFPNGKWLRDFCRGMIKRGYNKKVRISCNMRVDGCTAKDYELMAKAGFRFVLYGLESASQDTLDRICKGTKIAQIEEGVKNAKKAGLNPHLTCMIGYPWETKEDAQNTINFAKKLFKKGYADTLQATIVVPYPGTPLYEECRKEGLLNYDGIDEWEYYDMRQPVMKTALAPEEIKDMTQQLYKLFFTPRYIMNQLSAIKTKDDLKYIMRGAKKLFGHLKDFS